MATFQSLYASRCTLKDDKLIPNFWKPQPIAHHPLTLFADDDCPVDTDWECSDVIQRIIALGLHCEIPVGEFVQNAGKGDLPSDPILPVMLRSHVADEAAHDLGFRLAAEKYTPRGQYLAEARELAIDWQMTPVDHPIVPAAALEVGVFLASLGAMRLFGGNSLSHMASQIARDEYRHVAVNMAVMKGLGLSFSDRILNLVDDTVSWVFTDLNIPESETGITVDREFFRRSSRELVATGSARDLDDLTNYCNHYLPFEISNAALYTRGLDDSQV
jgi:hypothetical protein